MPQIPVKIIYKLEIGQRELLFNQRSQFFLNRSGPLADEYNKLVNIPCHPSTRHLSVVTLEFCFLLLGLSAKMLLSPHLAVQMWIVDKWQSLFSRFLRHLWRQFLLPYSKETFLGWIIPEDADAWHLANEICACRPSWPDDPLSIVASSLSHFLYSFK